MIRVGVIGYGYWGPNVVRNLHSLDSTRVEMVCDRTPAALARVRRSYPGITTVSDPAEILTSPQIDAVAVITPVWTHYQLAKVALENGKHIFVEKPFTSSTAQAAELIELADRKNVKIMVDHTFLFTGAVRGSNASLLSCFQAIRGRLFRTFSGLCFRFGITPASAASES